MLRNILLVAAGGAAGSVARYLLSKAVQGAAASAFPWGTMTVNIAGCLLIGFIGGLPIGGGDGQWDGLKLALTAGFCGGFTTFSTFANESLTLAKGGDALLPALYIGVSVAVGILAAAAGTQLAKALAG